MMISETKFEHYNNEYFIFLLFLFISPFFFFLAHMGQKNELHTLVRTKPHKNKTTRLTLHLHDDAPAKRPPGWE